MTISRRSFLAGAAVAAFSGKAPALSQGAGRVLKIIPSANPPGIDPIITSGQPIRNHGYHVYDTLFGMDSSFNIKPQMAEGFETSNDGLSYTITLREGLKFHDGEKVLAKDCVASLRRWGARDPLGQTIFELTNELVALDDRKLQFRLRRRFGLILHGLAKIGGPAPFIMPERIARTDPNTAIQEVVGSGPFRFVANEWNPGSRLVYAKFDGYVPRDEPASCTSGGKRVHVDRLEWHIVPDSATATAALQRGEVDWYQQPDLTLLPLLKQDRSIALEPFDDFGLMSMIRFNHLHPPFDRVEMRRVVQAAVNQIAYLQAEVGDPSLYKECKSIFFCGTKLSSGAGSDAMVGDFDRAKTMLRDAGYKGEKIVIIAPIDVVWLHNASLVTQDLFKRLDLNVEVQDMDLGTYFSRRRITEPVDKGGWSIFHTGASVTDVFDPSTHLALRGNGRQGWPGWPDDPVLEQLRDQWMAAESEPEQIALARTLEAHAFAQVPFVPLGQFQAPSAFRKNIKGLLKAPLPIAWNLQKL